MAKKGSASISPRSGGRASEFGLGFTRGRLRLLIISFSVALIIPIAVLLYRSYGQLETESYLQHRTLSEELAQRIDQNLIQLLNSEDERPIEDYSFFNVAGSIYANVLKLSPLTRFPVDDSLPGLVGYFQISPEGEFTTPLLPQKEEDIGRLKGFGIQKKEVDERLALQNKVRQILQASSLTPRRLQARKVTQITPPQNKYNQSFIDQVTESLGSRRDAVESQVGADEVQTISPTESSKPGTPGHLKKGVSASQPRFARQEASSTRPSAAADSRVRVAKKEMADSDGVNGSPMRLGALSKPQPSAPRDFSAGGNEFSALQANADQDQEESPFAGGIRDSLDDVAAEEKVAKVAPEPEALAPPKLSELELDSTLLKNTKSNFKAPSPKKQRVKRKVKVAIPEQRVRRQRAPRVYTFDGEIDPLQFGRLSTGHLVFYRKIWREQQRFIQGFLLEGDRVLDELIGRAFKSSSLSQYSSLLVAYRGDQVLSRYGANRKQAKGTQVFSRIPLSSPLSRVEMVFTIDQFPITSGLRIIQLLGGVLILILMVGTWVIYRVGCQQIDLVDQQRNFVSAVTHELRTPLTSIRMYGEILRSGWAGEEKRKKYYDFIFFESERLSRLISNVLQLARMNSQLDPKDSSIQLKPLSANQAYNQTLEKVRNQIEQAGFELEVQVQDTSDQLKIQVDADALDQIMINLVDNALKFSQKSECKKIELGLRIKGTSEQPEVEFYVRDHGPGIPAAKMKAIFKMFYRLEDEMTRTTTGTGIGLALVSQLCAQMDAQIHVLNREPGAEFQVRFDTCSVSPDLSYPE